MAKTTPTGPGDEMGPSIEQGAGSTGLGPSVPGSSGLGVSVEGSIPTGGTSEPARAGKPWADASKKGNVSQGFPVTKKP